MVFHINFFHLTLLFLAVNYNQLEIVEFLIGNSDYDINEKLIIFFILFLNDILIIVFINDTIFKFLYLNIKDQTRNVKTYLNAALDSRNENIVRIILEHQDFDVNKIDIYIYFFLI